MVSEKWDKPSWVESVVAGARNPENWLASARRSKRASDLLRKDWPRQHEAIRRSIATGAIGEPAGAPSVAAAAAFLGGTALENLLKGVLVARDPGLVQPNARKPDRMYKWQGSGHDLLRLARDARVPLLPSDTETLTVLTDFIGWAGRYPTGMSASGMRPTDERPHGRGFVSSEHFERLDDLFARLEDVLTNAAREQQRLEEIQERARRATRRKELLQELSRLDTVDTDGVRVYVAEADAPDAAPCVVVCGGCGAEIALNAHRPAAICRCGTLHHYRRGWLAGRWQAAVDTYPDTAQ